MWIQCLKQPFMALTLACSPEASCEMVLHGHKGAIWTVALSYPFAFSGGQDGSIRRWCLASESCLHVLQGHHDAVRCPSK